MRSDYDPDWSRQQKVQYVKQRVEEMNRGRPWLDKDQTERLTAIYERYMMEGIEVAESNKKRLESPFLRLLGALFGRNKR